MRGRGKLFIILSILLLLSACTIKDENTMRIDEKGKMNYEILVAFDREVLTNVININNLNNNKLTKISDSDMLEFINNDEIMNLSYLDGLNKNEYIDENYIGVKYSYSVNDINTISTDKEIKININNIKNNEKLINQKIFTKSNNRYSANYIFNFKEKSKYINHIIKFKLNLPHKAISHNATSTSKDGKTLIWDLSEDENEINFTFSLNEDNFSFAGNIFNKAYIIFIIPIILLVVIIVILVSRKWKETKKENVVIVLIVLLTIFIILLCLGIQRTITNESKKVKLLKKDNISSTSILRYNNTIYLNYDELNESNLELSKIINYSSSLDNIIDKLIKEDNNIKMYDENQNKVLETTISKEKARIIFREYFSIKNDVKTKILFKNAKDNEFAQSINFKVNREEILREMIVKTAREQIGNTGEKYWQYFGYNHRIEWCCIFVSWLADQYGLIDSGAIPKFTWVQPGVDFYRQKGQFKKSNEYIPKPGDIIFFNWNNNSVIDHVGIVEKVENDIVYAIEGNVGHKDVQRRKYKLKNKNIYGYGVPSY